MNPLRDGFYTDQGALRDLATDDSRDGTTKPISKSELGGFIDPSSPFLNSQTTRDRNPGGDRFPIPNPT